MLSKYNEKIMSWLAKLTPPPSVSNASRQIIFGAVGLVMLVVLLYLAGWCYNTYESGVANLKDLEVLLAILISPQNVAYVTFASVYLADVDGDGMPDAVEKQLEANENVRTTQ